MPSASASRRPAWHLLLITRTTMASLRVPVALLTCQAQRHRVESAVKRDNSPYILHVPCLQSYIMSGCDLPIRTRGVLPQVTSLSRESKPRGQLAGTATSFLHLRHHFLSAHMSDYATTKAHMTDNDGYFSRASYAPKNWKQNTHTRTWS